MFVENAPEPLITDKSVQEYFQDSISDALENQRIQAAQETVYYIVNLLATFMRSEELFERTPDGVILKPLADFYAEAVEGPTTADQHRALRRLGDVALFISGVFSHSLNRKLVDVDYYVAMGGGAYSYLSDSLRGSAGAKTLTEIFEELSAKFVDFVDVLGEVSERAHFSSSADIMRLYEIWVRTGSRRAERTLRSIGIDPTETNISRSRH
ncbi:MAG: hypothetical protein R3337_06450 [Gammaproteobacteria bacterium]|nr:hypothetical protein [Gammaproteobacteria bacterium]